MLLKIITLLLIILSNGVNCFAQAPKDTSNTAIDSLEAALKTAKKDTDKIKTLNILAWKLRRNNPKQALEYAKQALGLCGKQVRLKAEVYSNIAVIYQLQANYFLALENQLNALNIRKELNDRKGIAASYNNLGLIYWQQGEYPRALKYYFEALNIYEKIKLEHPDDHSNQKNMANTYNNVGIIYNQRGENKLALEYYFKALELKEKLNDKKILPSTYNNIAVVYYYQSKLDSSLQFHVKALTIRQEIGDKRGIASSYSNIGETYAELAKADTTAGRHKKFEQALNYQYKALEIKKELGDNYGLTYSLTGIGNIYIAQGKTKASLPWFKQSADMAEKIGAKPEMRDAYFGLYEAYKKLADGSRQPAKKSEFYIQALAYHEKYVIIKDTLLNEKNSKIIAEMSEKYESEKKEKQIKIQELELNRNRILQYTLTGGLLMLLVLSFVIYNRYRIKQKANALLEEQNQFISQQNEEINVQKEQLEDSNQKLEKRNKQITDSINYASRIQQSILPSDEFISKLLPDSFILFKPRDIVSGDFYWFSKKNNKILLAAVDCTGHGVPGAFMSMIGNTLLNEIINEKEVTKPADILDELNSGIKKALHQNDLTAGMQEQETTSSDDGMDLSLISIDPEKRSLTFAGAKRPLYIASNGTLNEIKGNVSGIGGSRKKTIKKFTQHEYSVKKGDTIYLFSDGYTDQFGGPDDTKFMTERFKRLLLDIHDLPMDKQRQKLENAIEEWKGESRQIDDILVIGVRI